MKKTIRLFDCIKILSAFVLIAAFIFAAILFEPSIKINEYKNLDTTKLMGFKSPIIFDSHKSIVPSSFFIENNYTPIEALPNHVTNAFIAAEDTRFYQHNGVDYYRIGGSMLKNIKSKGYLQGASTITQQLIKNTHLSSEKKLKRKINEVRLAIATERKYSKSKILEMYLNKLYFGNNIYGIGAAAQAYFNTNASNLDINQSAFLAAIINNPSKYNPLSNHKNANQRRRLILSLMKKNKLISAQEYNQNIHQDLSAHNIFLQQYSTLLSSQAHAIVGTDNLQDYQIYTYLDMDLQQKINQIINEYQFEHKENTIIHALVLTSSGEIVANCSTANKNLTNNFRQPGSLIKPAISYAPAFEKGLILPSTPILDQPKYFEEDYAPKNYKDKNLGWISVCDALKLSQNIPAIKLSELCGIEYSKQVAQKFGYSFDKNDDTLAVSLGGMTKGATLLQSANSFQAFANQGKFIRASAIDKIMDKDGNIVYKNKKKESFAATKETAYFINQILSECAKNGTAKKIQKGAAKTGTVGTIDGNTDAYAIAYDQKYIIAVWVGAKTGLMPNTISGGTHPCAIAKKIISLLPFGKEFNPPETIQTIDIDANEYLKRHKLTKATKKVLPKDRIKISSIKDRWPLEDAIY